MFFGFQMCFLFRFDMYFYKVSHVFFLLHVFFMSHVYLDVSHEFFF